VLHFERSVMRSGPHLGVEHNRAPFTEFAFPRLLGWSPIPKYPLLQHVISSQPVCFVPSVRQIPPSLLVCIFFIILFSAKVSRIMVHIDGLVLRSATRTPQLGAHP
jgi:hypothetical protein